MKEEFKRYKVICPLINFQIQNILIGHPELSNEEAMELLKKRGNELVEGIDLFDGMRIRRVSKEDLEDVETSPILLPPHTLRTAAMFVLEKFITKEKEEFGFEIHNTMMNSVLALRLLKKGNVIGNTVFYILVPERKLRSSSWEEEPIPESYGPSYALTFDEIPILKKILEKVQGVDFAKRKSLHLACKRFQRAYGESYAEDKLIDFMIAFEALFLKGEKAGTSPGQIVTIACSTLLGKNDEERDEIRRFLTEAYSIRNCVVHGSECKEPIVYKGEKYDMSKFVSKIEDYLRESIKKLLD